MKMGSRVCFLGMEFFFFSRLKIVASNCRETIRSMDLPWSFFGYFFFFLERRQTKKTDRIVLNGTIIRFLFEGNC